MAKNKDEELIAMGFTPQEIAQVNVLSKTKASGGMYDSAWQRGQNANWAINDSNARREAAIKDLLGKRGSSGKGGGGAASGQDTFSGISDPEVFNLIKGKLSGILGGTDEGANLAKQQKQESIGKYDQLLADYSKRGAFTDAASLMQQNLNAAMEANKPAIQRAMEGSGTSAGSMQALLSQQLSDKAALSAGALGAEQAKSYGQIAASLMSGRGQLTQGRDTGISDVVGLADLLKINKSSSYGNFDPASMMNAETNRMKLQQDALNPSGGGGGATKTWSTYGPDSANQWMTKPGSLEDQFRTGKANPLDPANNLLYGSNGTY
jgi:hypothetical protein